MKILEIELRGFRPFSLGDIRTFQWTITQPVSIVCANNGIGKSALFRELTPYPATRSDYEADGYKRIVIEHGGSNYVLVSDFSEKKAHSFCKDGVELNESGNTDIQQELAIKEFGYDDKFKKLMTGKYEFSKMGRTERRNLLTALYPTDMSFITDYYRKVSSMVKGFKSNIAMLNNRQSELKGQLLEDARLFELQKQVTQKTELLAQLNQQIILTKNDLEQQHELIRQMGDRYIPTEPAEAAAMAADIQQALTKLIRETFFAIGKQGELYNKGAIPVLGQELAFKYADLQNREEDRKAAYDADAMELRERLEEMEDCKRLNGSTQKPILLEQINSLQKQLEYYQVEDSIPVMDQTALALFEDKLANMQSCLIQINAYVMEGGKIYTPEQLQDLITNKAKIEAQLSQANYQLQQLQEQHQAVDAKLQSLSSKLPPAACAIEVCGLKQSVLAMHQKLESEQLSLIEKIGKEESLIKSLKSELEPLNNSIQSYYSVEPFVRRFSEIISRNAWEFFIESSTGMDLYQLLGTDPLKLSDLFQKITKNSTSADRARKIQKELDECRKSLEVLSKAELPNQQVLDKLMNDLQTKLNDRLTMLDHLDVVIKKVGNKRKILDKILKMKTELYQLWTNFDNRMNSLKAQVKREYLTRRHQWLVQYHTNVNLELTSVQKSFHDQEMIRCRLNDEIIPLLERYTRDYNAYSLVADALSPLTGIATERMVLFINSVIEKVNMVIKYVLTYDLEIAYLKPGDDLTCDFHPILNKRWELKDISYCSDGQQDAINLAFTLALCHELKVGQIYPIQMDEVDAQFSEIHRTNLFNLISEMIDEQWIGQLFLINHYATLYSSFNNADIVCLSEDGIVVPNEYNLHTKINE